MTHAPPAAQPDGVAAAGQRGLLVIEALARAARQVALYGPDHPIAASALHEAWRELSAEANRGEIVLQVEETGLRWNGAAIGRCSNHVHKLHQAMRERMVATAKLTGTLEMADLSRLLQLLAEDAQLLMSSGGLMRAFGPEGSGGLLVEDIDFKRSLRECEAAWIEVCQEVDPQAVEPMRRILETCLHLVRSVGEQRTLEEIRAAAAEPVAFDPTDLATPTEAIAALIAGLIQSAGEIALHTGAANFQRWQASLLQQLEALGAYWSAYIFRAPAPPSDGAQDVLALLTREMSFERRIGLVLDYPGSVTTERSEGLALVLRRLLSESEESFGVERALHERALASGVPEQVYRNVVGMLMPDLTKQRRVEGVQVVVEGSAGLPANPKAELADVFSTLEPRALRRSRVHMLLHLLGEEVNASQYASLMKALGESLQHCVRLGEGGLVIAVLERLLAEATEGGGQSSGRRAMAEGALQRSVSANAIALVMRELERRPAAERSGLVELLGKLGEAGREALIDLARHSHEVEAQEALRVLAEHDAPAFSNLRELLSELPVVDLERALRTLLHLSHPHLANQISVAATHADPQARLALLRAVEATKSARGAEVAVRLLADPLSEIRIAAAVLLGQLRVLDAVPGLCYLLGRESDFGTGAAVKEAAARALGRINSPEAVPALAEFLVSGGLLARFARTAPRQEAVEALRRIGTPEARRALEEWRRCPQAAVRDLCLRRLSELSRPAGNWQGEGGRVG